MFVNIGHLDGAAKGLERKRSSRVGHDSIAPQIGFFAKESLGLISSLLDQNILYERR